MRFADASRRLSSPRLHLHHLWPGRARFSDISGLSIHTRGPTIYVRNTHTPVHHPAQPYCKKKRKKSNVRGRKRERESTRLSSWCHDRPAVSDVECPLFLSLSLSGVAPEWPDRLFCVLNGCLTSPQCNVRGRALFEMLFIRMHMLISCTGMAGRGGKVQVLPTSLAFRLELGTCPPNAMPPRNYAMHWWGKANHNSCGPCSAPSLCVIQPWYVTTYPPNQPRKTWPHYTSLAQVCISAWTPSPSGRSAVLSGPGQAGLAYR